MSLVPASLNGALGAIVPPSGIGPSGKPVIAVTLYYEGLAGGEIDDACQQIARATGVEAFDVLRDGADGLVGVLTPRLGQVNWRRRRAH